jgi:Transglycosylase-like domain
MRTRGRFFTRLTVLVLAFSVLAADAPAATAGPSAPVMEKIRKFRAETWRWQRLMRVQLTPNRREAERSRSTAYRRLVLSVWKERAAKARWQAHHPRRLGAWLCIHRHEGPWNANTGNGYYGGLQMDMAFQRTYAPYLLSTKGPAHRWTAIEQIWVAERAYRSGRGFSPWPNTARACGLI